MAIQGRINVRKWNSCREPFVFIKGSILYSSEGEHHSINLVHLSLYFYGRDRKEDRSLMVASTPAAALRTHEP